ncbi:MAG: hypothetical protein LWW77_11965 [Propionibacteriales bacterium]|nr:hypothetical protein [Propionibacteriales bacterium]
MTVRHELKRHSRRLGTAVVAISLLFGLQAIAAPSARATGATLTVSGGLKVGDTLGLSPSGFSTAPSSYSWYSYTAPSGGSGAWVGGNLTYTLSSGDVGHYILVFTHTATDGDVLSERVGPVEAVVMTPGTPAVSGTAIVGASLWADPGTWDPTPDSYSYQWLRNGSVISGETSEVYRLVAADLGAKISVRVTGTKTGYDDVTATSAESDTVAAAPAATLTAFTASDVVIGSGRCVSVPVSATYQVSTYEAWAVTNVTLTSKVTNKRGKKLGTVTLTGSGPDYTPAGAVSPNRRADLVGTATGTFKWCTGDYLGAIKFAAPKGTWTGTYTSGAVGGSVTSTLTATGHVKATIAITTPKLTVKGTTRTLAATIKTWVPDVKGWRALAGSKVDVQKLVDGNWVKLKTVRLSHTGKLKTSWKATAATSYRLVFGGNSVTVDGTSAVVTG